MSGGTFSLFLLAAVIVATIPGPGILYVAARTLAGGRRAGVASTCGTALGGCIQVVAGAVGVSALILASAELFTLLKLIGALYLLWLGIKTFRAAGGRLPEPVGSTGTDRAFRDGLLVETLNPKTAAFFLAFIPQFVDPTVGHPALQYVALGLVSVTLNTFVDVVVVFFAAKARAEFVRREGLVRQVRQGSGLIMAGLGISLAFARRPATG